MNGIKKYILFLIMGRDVPSSKFRVLGYLPFLEEMGWNYRIFAGGTGLWMKWKILKIAGDIDLIFIQKKLFPSFYLRMLKKRNPNIIFDFDDALFAREPTEKPFRLRKPGTRYTKRRLQEVLQLAVHVIAGNRVLAGYAELYTQKLSIIPTPVKLSDYSFNKKGEGPVVIGWLGTGRNLIYLREIESAIQRIATQFPEVEWRILSDRSYELDGVSIRNIRWDDSTAMKELSRFDIGLMPLFNDLWSRGKCAFKILQYMASGIPCVASPVGMNTEIIEEGVTGYLAGNTKEWSDILIRLIRDGDLRRRIGKNARQFVEKEFFVENCWEKLKGVLASYLIE
jgi:glycosyltransferase involved in cell wall biosynthesis